ncbi:ferrous iron transporter B [Ferrovum myxofaciens]|jgi:ferrous iron transport protein B|uniref:Ferrous iron transport protein B n=3 Tax=root TaxID=1 RepID=A0A8F3DRZ0_9PROT|nr:ferrous iron transporter B [Ferrovum myxofaciens]MBW8028723.1 ferrous iron transporter B [Ferrovum sp.]KXW57699.1 ferrous iron transport protein B [Ferrovum myxofaciens]MBU6994676.1 ferrous iron transporter B [Ferrovum myxofaciens]QKE38527.1 MAG: ferrous iron transporter B [Ferrovum myxofaciens]QKE41063.1 MAG: ferrous iron transporter B [Ferrovum myxofaciens]
MSHSTVAALVGAPNCGKTALFNRLTGSHQKVANYAGVTVERKEGSLTSPQGKRIQIVDLPGTYSLTPTSLDESITRRAVLGQLQEETPPELLVCVVDATNLRLHLRLVLELKRLGRPLVLALNMMDLARSHGILIDVPALSRELDLPVVETIAVDSGGAAGLVAFIDQNTPFAVPARTVPWKDPTPQELQSIQLRVRTILAATCDESKRDDHWNERIDRVVMHPLWGMLILALVLFLTFQAVFTWATIPMDLIKGVVGIAVNWVHQILPAGLLRSLLADGVLNGAGSVLMFLPQILILFAFILALEDSGYLPRAAFLLDRVMGTVGLSGRSFIPLLSSFACAIPGIMATRTIQNPRDRLTTILIAPLMTCSARLPVYALLISAFIPNRPVLGLFNLQGVVLFILYCAGIISAMGVALIMKQRARHRYQALMMELPAYRLPNLRNLVMGLVERGALFIMRTGTIILPITIVIWFLSAFPPPPPGLVGPAIRHSFAGMIGQVLGVFFSPIGFNWQICIALIPGMVAREVAVGALGTVYSLSGEGGNSVSEALAPVLAHSWSLPTALALLAWYVYAPQCVATLSAVRRETGSWRIPSLMLVYLFGLAYGAAFITYHVALAFTGA